MGASYDKAWILYRQKRFAQAREELARELSSEPQSSNAHALLALCMTSQQQFRSAREAAEKAISLAPQSPYAHYALAWVFFLDIKYACRRGFILSQNQVELRRSALRLAEKSIQEALRLAPHEPGYHSLHALILHDLGDKKGCMREALAGLAINPKHPESLRAQALASRSLKGSEAAVAASAQALSVSPDSAVEHVIHARTLFLSGRWEQAMTHLNEAMRIDPTSRYVRSAFLDGLRSRYPPYRLFLRAGVGSGARAGPATATALAIGVLMFIVLLFPPICTVILFDNLHLSPAFDGPLFWLSTTPLFLFLTSRVWANFLMQFDPRGREVLTSDQRKQADFLLATTLGVLVFIARSILAATGYSRLAESVLWVGITMIVAALVTFWAWGRRRFRSGNFEGL